MYKETAMNMDMTTQDAISRAPYREKWKISIMELPLRALASSRY